MAGRSKDIDRDKHFDLCYSIYDYQTVYSVVNELERRFNFSFSMYDRHRQSTSSVNVSYVSDEKMSRSRYALIFLTDDFLRDPICALDEDYALTCCQEKNDVIVIVKVEDFRIPRELQLFTCIDATIPNIDLPAEIASALNPTCILKSNEDTSQSKVVGNRRSLSSELKLKNTRKDQVQADTSSDRLYENLSLTESKGIVSEVTELNLSKKRVKSDEDTSQSKGAGNRRSLSSELKLKNTRKDQVQADTSSDRLYENLSLTEIKSDEDTSQSKGAGNSRSVSSECRLKDTRKDEVQAETSSNPVYMDSCTTGRKDIVSKVKQPILVKKRGRNRPWGVCIARKDKKAADELIERGIIPKNKELIQVCNEFGRKSETFSKVCDKISESIKNKSKKIVDALATYKINDCDENGQIRSLYFVVFFVKDCLENVKIEDYKTVFRCVSDFNEESMLVQSNELSSIASIMRNEREVVEQLRKSISDHADQLMDDHRYVSVISPSLKRSVDFKTCHYRILDEPCIAIYVPMKGFIPIQEDPLPIKIDGFYVDVLEGEFNPFTGRPNDFHIKLKMGLAIHANIVDNDGAVLAGTLGGFLDHPEHGLCGVTCAHVVSTPDELTRKGSIFRPTDRQVFQPVGVESKPFGNVVCIINDNGDESRPGMEVAVFKIRERHPENGMFPIAFNIDEAGFDDDNPLTYNTGEVREASEIRRRTEVFKFGMASGVTRGSFGLQGSVVRKEEMQGQRNGFGFRLKNQMVILQIGQHSFAEEGDSGALVLVEDTDSGSVAIGIVEGGIQGRVFVTPICDILRALNCTQIRMKQFTCIPDSNHMCPSASVVVYSSINSDEQMEVSGQMYV